MIDSKPRWRKELVNETTIFFFSFYRKSHRVPWNSRPSTLQYSETLSKKKAPRSTGRRVFASYSVHLRCRLGLAFRAYFSNKPEILNPSLNLSHAIAIEPGTFHMGFKLPLCPPASHQTYLLLSTALALPSPEGGKPSVFKAWPILAP